MAIIVPFWLGARQVDPLLFLVFVPVASLALTVGMRVTKRVQRPFQWERFTLEATVRAMVIFFVGGPLFILAYLVF